MQISVGGRKKAGKIFLNKYLSLPITQKMDIAGFI
jgi:hypothetical protein